MTQEKIEAVRWSLARRAAVRFLFVYLILFGVPMVLDALPESAKGLSDAHEGLLKAVLPWVGKHVLRLRDEFPMQQTGSGDRTADYVQILSFLAIAAAAALVWSILDRRRPHHEKIA